MRSKAEVREHVWAAMSAAGVARFPGAKGRIPNFTGAEAAAEHLAALPEWERARSIKANPDSPQWPVRTRGLADGIDVFMAVPRLREEHPFLLLDPERIRVKPRAAASIKGSATHGVPVAVEDLPHIDLIVCGTVAVNPAGVRIGKGGGFSDLEFALGVEAGVIDERTVIATTVHEVQVLDEDLPETEHDFGVDLIVTPERTVRTGRTRRPPGILWDHLDEDKIASIPVLRR